MQGNPADIWLVPFALVFAFFLWASLAPFETLGWWAGWFGDKIYNDQIPSDGVVRTVHENSNAYVLFLSGIGRVSGHTLSFREQDFLHQLAQRAPDAVVIDDIFPYSVNNLALTGQPYFSRIWKWALARKRYGPALAGYLINIRNLFQVAIAIDRRYSPLYGQAMAEVFLDSLLRYQYDPESKTPIFIVGYSGSAQMGIGAITYLREWVKGPIYMVSMGGIFGSDPGVLVADHVYHLWGTNDIAQVWRYLMPGRWPIFPSSEWNRALRQRRVTIIRMPNMGHTGRGGYIDVKPSDGSTVPNGQITAQTIANLIQHAVEGHPIKGPRIPPAAIPPTPPSGPPPAVPGTARP
jgi:hypothetical protein